MDLFIEQIKTWQDWGKVFQSIPAFTSLVEYIFKKVNLPIAQIENLTPGTNAVFKVGSYIIKIFAPEEAGMGIGTDFDTELFGIKRANALCIPSPKLIASGVVNDKYQFRYMIMEYINATALGDFEKNLSFKEKVIIGRKLRIITDKLNTPCANYDPVDIIENTVRNDGWVDYPDSFNAERLAYTANMKINKSEKVYCHGDLNPDNILIDKNLELYIIDFADSVYAPAGYEQAIIACELFCFEKPYMLGYFGNYAANDIVDLCSTWLPVHDSGEHTLRCNIGPACEITSFKVMRERLYNLIKSEEEKTPYNDVVTHYDALISEINDPVRDPVPLRDYMDKWDGEAFIEALKLTPDKSVLEIGVGTGRLAVRVCDKCRRFAGIDISPKTIQRAKENLQGFANINMINSDFITNQFNEKFDTIYSSLTFMHIKDKRAAIRKIANLLNPNGLFVLSIDKNQQREIDYGSRKIIVYPDTAEEISDLIMQAGLTIEKQFETEFAVIFTARKGV